MAPKIDANSASQEEILEAPEIPRKLRFWSYQWIGMPFLMAIPVLSLFGVFGQSKGTVSNQSKQIALEVVYPTRIRHWQNDSIQVTVRNLTNRSLADLAVEFEPSYLEKFSNLNFVPEAKSSFRVEISKLSAGERQQVFLELQADDYGVHRGRVRVTESGAEAADVEMKTLVFP